MRVIGGKFRGKILKSPVTNNIRPTGDKVKQALFTKLQFFIADKVVLDLFSGSGALGIEALSRGARMVYFVDKDYKSIALTKENLKGIDAKNFEVIPLDYKMALMKITEKLDLILVDPPYASGVYEDVLNIIKEKNLLSDDGIIVCEHPYNMKIDSAFETFDKKRYGTVELTYLKMPQKIE